MIEKFKSNAEAIATADKYLYGNHARMPIAVSYTHLDVYKRQLQKQDRARWAS